MAVLNTNTEKLISSINERGETWHREIDNIIRTVKSYIRKTRSKHVGFIKEQGDEINHTFGELKKLKDSNNVSLLIQYKSRPAEFRRLSPKPIVIASLLKESTQNNNL